MTGRLRFRLHAGNVGADRRQDPQRRVHYHEGALVIFPMSENPEVFKKYLMPVLDRLLEYARDRRPASGSDRRPKREETPARASSRRW